MRNCIVLSGVIAASVLFGCGGNAGHNASEGTLTIGHLDAATIATSADTVNIRVLDRNGKVIEAKDGVPVQDSYSLPNVSSRGKKVEVTYFKGATVVGDAGAEIDLQDGKEEVTLGGNPLGPYDLVANDRGWSLRKAGTPTVIKGVGFDYTRLDQNSSGAWFRYVDPMITKLGANTIRLYGIPWTDGGAGTPGSPAYQAQDVSKMLEFAAKNRMQVLVGVFVDGSATADRVTQFVNLVRADPNFGSVFGWCVGNEVPSSSFAQVDQLTKTIKGLMKPAANVRPVMTALPSVSSGFVATINSTMPSLDMIGINTFYGSFDAKHSGGGYLNTQAASLKSGGWKKPWVITEYYSYDIQSPDMPYQVLNGGNKYMLELNSTLNAQNYANSYSKYIVSAAAKQAGSIGGFMLNYGPPHNSKLVASWLQPFAYTGAFTPFVNPPWNKGADSYLRFAATDAIATLYGGSFGSVCPQIVLDTDQDPQGISCDFKATLNSPGKKLAAGQTGVTASVLARSGSLTFRWYLIGGNSADGFSGNVAGPGINPQAYSQPTTLDLGGDFLGCWQWHHEKYRHVHGPECPR